MRKPVFRHATPAPVEKSHVRQGRHPLRPLAHRLPAHRRRAHGAVQLALSPATPAARCCCASRTPTASARPKPPSQAILDGLTWLGLDWDGEPISQFERAARHARGRARSCCAAARPTTATPRPRNWTEMREKARAEGRPPRYDGRWRDRDPSEAPAGVAPVIRIKAPREGETVVHDHVQGEVRVPEQEPRRLHHPALRRHADLHARRGGRRPRHGRHPHHPRRRPPDQCRAPDRSSTTRMGWDVPEMAHIPLIHGADGAKLSKRHGALGVEAYRAMGYLPEALRNYLARLGWSHGDDEIISTERDGRVVRASRTSTRARRASTSSSSRRSTATTSAAWTTPSCSTSSSTPCPIWRAAERSPTRLDAERARRSCSPPCPGSRSAPRRWSNWSTAHVPLCRAAAADRREGRRRCLPRRARRRSCAARMPRSAASTGDWSAAIDGGRDPRLRRGQRAQARQGRAAAARRAHRQDAPRRAFSRSWRCSGATKAWRGIADQID